MSSTNNTSLDMQRQATRVLRKIVPWITDSTSSVHRTNHKGVRGRIGIVGGARDYAGAPYFAAMAAMRLGADLAYVICSREASHAIKNYSPDLIVTPLLDCLDEGEFSRETDCLLSRMHALVIGPGLSRDEFLQERARSLFKKANDLMLPIILDADALLMVNDHPALIKSSSNVLLTPNRIELQRLLNSHYAPEEFNLKDMSVDGIQDLVKKYSSDMRVTVLAKGMTDIICDHSPPFQLSTDPSSGSSRRCGGQGDITSGLAGVYIHWINQANNTSDNDKDQLCNKLAWAGYLAAATTRRCNEIAYDEHHDGMLASHMLERIQEAFRGLLNGNTKEATATTGEFEYAGLLSKDEIGRYARQMIMEEFGPQRQANLKKASALIIGAGGLGCPAAVYLGAGGIGCLGVVDDDRVEASNLHRQILHNMEKVGELKTESIKQAVLAINPNVKVVAHSVKMNRHNAVDLVEKYDIIIDCTDNLLTRYMISDACVIAKKPLVSGAALKMDGQLTVYNYDDETPCFRCLFPEPPPPNAVGSCSDNGVLGVLPGIIGVHQALEAMKIAAGLRPAYAGKMLLFDGQLGLFRHATLGKKKPDCGACGKDAKLGRDLIDYEKFCGQVCSVDQKSADLLDPEERITVEQYGDILRSGKKHVLVDVRPREHSNISRFSHALQLPVMFMLQNQDETIKTIRTELSRKETNEIYVVCRRGIASQRGARLIQQLLAEEPDLSGVVVKDIIGGMTSWAKHGDPQNYSCV
uniref:Adenylyltransferase and sulfurtransferase MOCS3 homolog n=2 Tax=Aceria tosichella TaxID=561515 RepID=A0A6G1SPY1_9ACAR